MQGRGVRETHPNGLLRGLANARVGGQIQNQSPLQSASVAQSDQPRHDSHVEGPTTETYSMEAAQRTSADLAPGKQVFQSLQLPSEQDQDSGLDFGPATLQMLSQLLLRSTQSELV